MSWMKRRKLKPDAYPVKPLRITSIFSIMLSRYYRCFDPDTVEFIYHNYSIPESEKEGYMLRFHDPYEIVSKDATTFYTINNREITLGITPKVSRIDESLENENPEL